MIVDVVNAIFVVIVILGTFRIAYRVMSACFGEEPGVVHLASTSFDSVETVATRQVKEHHLLRCRAPEI